MVTIYETYQFWYMSNDEGGFKCKAKEDKEDFYSIKAETPIGYIKDKLQKGWKINDKEDNHVQLKIETSCNIVNEEDGTMNVEYTLLDVYFYQDLNIEEL